MKRKKGRRLELRTTQKTSIRYVYAAGSLVMVAVVLFIYINFSGSKESKADNDDNAAMVTYQTTDDIVSSRLLLKSHPEIKLSTATYNPKTEAGYKSIRIGRSNLIQKDRYITN